MAIDKNEKVERAQKQLQEFLADPETRAIWDLKEKAEMERKFDLADAHNKGERKGIKKGIKKGRIEERIKIAKNLLECGVSTKHIQKSTGLSMEEINELKEEVEEDSEFAKKDSVTNEVVLVGFICKKPIYRQTPFGREIADILLAVNRAYNKSDYIPSIAWGRNARFSQNLEVGTKVKIVGRVQSREYEKKFEDGRVENRIAYEVSIGSLEIVEEVNPEKEAEVENVEEDQEAV